MPKESLLAVLLITTVLVGLTSCSTGKKEDASTNGSSQQGILSGLADSAKPIQISLPLIDMSAWQYEEQDGVYYQMEISYCQTPKEQGLEKLAVFVPAGFLDGRSNGDGTYTCTLNDERLVSSFTAQEAPIVFLMNRGAKSPEEPVSGYQDVHAYTDLGMLVVLAGRRGDTEVRNALLDMKAAIRYIRYNEERIPGSMERIYAFGKKDPAFLALLGISGDAEVFREDLTSLGAVQYTSDSLSGAMCLFKGKEDMVQNNDITDPLSPFYYLSEDSEGYNSSLIAPNWYLSGAKDLRAALSQYKKEDIHVDTIDLDLTDHEAENAFRNFILSVSENQEEE